MRKVPLKPGSLGKISPEFGVKVAVECDAWPHVCPITGETNEVERTTEGGVFVAGQPYDPDFEPIRWDCRVCGAKGGKYGRHVWKRTPEEQAQADAHWKSVREQMERAARISQGPGNPMSITLDSNALSTPQHFETFTSVMPFDVPEGTVVGGCEPKNPLGGAN